MNKFIKPFFVVFIMFVLNVLCFSEPPVNDKLSRNGAIACFAVLVRDLDSEKELLSQKCPKCHNYASDQVWYRVYNYQDGKSYHYFGKFCNNCNYFEFGYENGYGNHYLYQGTK